MPFCVALRASELTTRDYFFAAWFSDDAISIFLCYAWFSVDHACSRLLAWCAVSGFPLYRLSEAEGFWYVVPTASCVPWQVPLSSCAMAAADDASILAQVESELKFQMDEAAVPLPIQLLAYRNGFDCIRVFASIDETKAEVSQG